MTRYVYICVYTIYPTNPYYKLHILFRELELYRSAAAPKVLLLGSAQRMMWNICEVGFGHGWVINGCVYATYIQTYIHRMTYNDNVDV